MRWIHSSATTPLFLGMIVTLALLPEFSNTSILAAEFGMVEIVVTGPGGTRLSNANLCLAMPGQSMQKMTDQNGSYKTPLPVGSTTVHASRGGYTNGQITIVMTNSANLVREIQLQPGQSTPLPSDCGSIPATTIPGNSCDVITGIRLTGGTTTTNRTVTIHLDFSTWPHAYRLTDFTQEESFRDNFNPEDGMRQKNVPWLRAPQSARNGLTVSFTLTQPYYGTHAIYVQTQKFQNGCVSRPRVVSVVLAPAAMGTYILTNENLERFVTAATNRGYRFNASHEFLMVPRDAYCGPGQPLYTPQEEQRVAENVMESIRANFEVFIGPEFNPYWKLTHVQGRHEIFDGPGYTVPLLILKGTKPAMVWAPDFTGISGPPAGAPKDSPTRMLYWRRYLYPIGDDRKLKCAPGRAGAHLTMIALEGPANADPLDALPPLRQRPVSDLSPTLQLPKGDPLPKVVFPRGIDETEKTEDRETVDKTPESEKTP